MQLRGDVREAGREGFGFLDDVVEDERAPESLLRGRLEQGGLEGCEPGPASERPSAPRSCAAWSWLSVMSTHTTWYGAQIPRSIASDSVSV